VDDLSRFDRATIGLWRGGDAALRAHADRPLAEAAAHAVLAGLRRCRDRSGLLAAYARGQAVQADLALVASLVGGGEALGRAVRDAAFYLRWRELGERP
jgi:hypothetical protein